MRTSPADYETRIESVETRIQECATSGSPAPDRVRAPIRLQLPCRARQVRVPGLVHRRVVTTRRALGRAGQSSVVCGPVGDTRRGPGVSLPGGCAEAVVIRVSSGGRPTTLTLNARPPPHTVFCQSRSRSPHFRTRLSRPANSEEPFPGGVGDTITGRGGPGTAARASPSCRGGRISARPRPAPRSRPIGRRQTADGRRQTADGRRQTADGRRQTADGRQQAADGCRRQAKSTFSMSMVTSSMSRTTAPSSPSGWTRRLVGTMIPPNSAWS